MQPPDTKVSC